MLKAKIDLNLGHTLLRVVANDVAVGGIAAMVGPVVFQRISEGMEVPVLIAGKEADDLIRAICAAAYEAGIYPIQLDDMRQELAATKKHLRDMRALVFNDKEQGEKSLLEKVGL